MKGKNIIVSFDKLRPGSKLIVYHTISWILKLNLTVNMFDCEFEQRLNLLCLCAPQWARPSPRWASSRPSVRATSTCTGAPGSSAACLTPTTSSTRARYHADAVIPLNSEAGYYWVCGGVGESLLEDAYWVWLRTPRIKPKKGLSWGSNTRTKRLSCSPRLDCPRP